MAKDLFRDPSQTEFVIATIPTVLGINESARLAGTLAEEGIPCKRLVVNQARRAARAPCCALRCISFWHALRRRPTLRRARHPPSQTHTSPHTHLHSTNLHPAS